jgi:hypothetical protein
VILKKLEYYKQGGSTKHLEDVRSMLRVSPEEIDMNYLNRWVAELGLADPWKEAQAK